MRCGAGALTEYATAAAVENATQVHTAGVQWTGVHRKALVGGEIFE